MTLKLPLLAPHDATLQKCVYCPKLSRAACPISNVEANETVTPWGKMSMAYFTAREDVPIDEDHADPAWACSACYACRERCEHRNEVATVLCDARAEYFARGVAPEPARRAAASFSAHDRACTEKAEELDAGGAWASVLLVGCSYLRHAPEVAAAIVNLARRFVGPVRVARRCCGLPLLYAGDRDGFIAAARAMHAELGGAHAVVADPGCARALLVDYPRVGIDIRDAQPLVDRIFASMDALPFASLRGGPVRYTDPCQLGRGLGRYEEPRAILARLTGSAPLDMHRHRDAGECSGGGGLLPLTRPQTSRAMADALIAEHHVAGGGLLVTACGSSLRRFRSRGEPAEDLYSLVAAAFS